MTSTFFNVKKLKNIIKHSFLYGKNIRYRIFNFLFPNFLDIVNSKVIFKDIPKCIQRTFITGNGKVYIGSNCNFGFKLGGFYRGGSIELQARFKVSKIVIGDNVGTNNNVFICAANVIEIGADTLIGQNVFMMDFEAHGIDPEKRRKIGEIGEIYVGRNVWIGNNVTILKNSRIGDDSIVAAGSVVTGIFPKNVIIGGIPARIIKEC